MVVLRKLLARLALPAALVEAETTTIRGVSFGLVTTGTAATTATTATTATGGSTTMSAPTVTKSISVGYNPHKFSPESVEARVGDVIEFRFYPGNHSVARSEFLAPCIPYESAAPNHIGFSSGPHNPAGYSDDAPTFRVKINDTYPVFFYCFAPGSCKDYQMLGVINPNSTHTLEKQKAKASTTGILQLAPGEPWPKESDHSSGQSNSGGSSSQLSAGAIAGIAIGGFVALFLAGTLIFICGRKSRDGCGGWSTIGFSSARAAIGRNGPAGPPDGPRDEGRNSFPVGAMTEAKYHHPNSPGNETFTTTSSSVVPSHEGSPISHHHQQHHAGAAPPSWQQHHSYQFLPSQPRSPPSPHPGMPNSYQPYGATTPPFPNPGQHMSHPYGGGGGQGPLEMHCGEPLLPPPQGQPAVELPSSADPGNSPLPGYSSPTK